MRAASLAEQAGGQAQPAPKGTFCMLYQKPRRTECENRESCEHGCGNFMRTVNSRNSAVSVSSSVPIVPIINKFQILNEGADEIDAVASQCNTCDLGAVASSEEVEVEDAVDLSEGLPPLRTSVSKKKRGWLIRLKRPSQRERRRQRRKVVTHSESDQKSTVGAENDLPGRESGKKAVSMSGIRGTGVDPREAKKKRVAWADIGIDVQEPPGLCDSEDEEYVPNMPDHFLSNRQLARRKICLEHERVKTRGVYDDVCPPHSF